MRQSATIVIYRFTGRQGFFTIPKSWCEECDLLVNLVKGIIKEQKLQDTVTLVIRPWWLWWWLPLVRYGSLHAPQLVINDKLVSAGTVPPREAVEKAMHTS